MVVPWFLVSTYEGERLSLPMIDVKFTEMHCRMVFGDCLAKAGGSTNDVTVFLQALEKRGPDSRHPAQQIGLENAGLSGL